MIEKCRLCGAELGPALLHYDNLPDIAQNLPTEPNSRGETLEVFRCSGCGMVQTGNAPVPYYREVIRASAVSAEMKAFRERQFADWCGKYQLAGKRVIEYGCGQGEYLRLLPTTVRAFGMEYGAESVTKCRKEGLSVFRGYFEKNDEEIEPSGFDGFLILNFLEHLPNLNTYLRGIAHNLVAGGVGLVEVPNFEMILKRKLFTEFSTEHLFYFTGETLRTALNLNGFEVLSCRSVWYDYILSAEVRLRPAGLFAGFAEASDRLCASLRNFAARYARVAVWGAGHQALALLAMSGIADRIAFVVDSSPAKQGRYTPATNRPIVSPLYLAEHLPEAVLVIAGGYSAEIVQNLKKQYGQDIKVAIVQDIVVEC